MVLSVIPTLPTSSTLHKNVGVVLYYKDKRAFITDATVTFEKQLLQPYQANKLGVLYYASIPRGVTVGIFAQKTGIDFGNGVSQKARIKVDIGFDSIVHEFTAITPVPCPNINPQITSVFNFDSLLITPSAIPTINITGVINIPGATYEIKLDSNIVYNGTIPDAGSINNIQLPMAKNIILSNINNNIFNTEANIELLIYWYNCSFRAVRTVRLPVKPITPTQCVGEIKPDLIKMNDLIYSSKLFPTSLPIFINTTFNGKPSNIPLGVYVNNRKVASITGNQTIDALRILSGEGLIDSFNPSQNTPQTIVIKYEGKWTDCNIPDVDIHIPAIRLPPVTLPTDLAPSEICGTPGVTAGIVSLPSGNTLPDNPTTPFFISINDVRENCKKITSSTGKGMGKVTLGNLSGTFDVPSPGQSPGEVYFDLSKIINITSLISGIQTPDTVVTKPTLPTKPRGRFNGSAALATSYLATFYPGSFLSVEQGYVNNTAVKITRTNSSYFYAQSYEDIDKWIR